MPLHPGQTKTDLVCGMTVLGLARVVTGTYRGKTYQFCSEQCLTRFRKNPKKYFGPPLLELWNVWKIFKTGGAETQALRGFDLHVWEGDFVAIIGASGSGKSTVLNMIGLLDRPTKGQMFVNGRDMNALAEDDRARLRSRMFGFVFQQYNLIPWLSAYENVILPLIFSDRTVDRKKVEREFDQFGIKQRMTHRPHELSGGEQQRTALLRALANDPEIILGDEPTGNLDSVTGAKILERLIDLNKREKKTLIIVTHDAAIADLADQIIAVKDGKSVQNHQAHRRALTH